MRPFTEARGRRAVAASLLAVVLLGGYFGASAGDLGAFPAVYAVHAVVLALAFWFPAMKIGGPADLRRLWRSLLPWLLGWTLVWDLATAGLVGGRALFEEWWVVYPSGVLLLALLLLLHAAAVRRWARRSTRP
ncbi:MAG TPA: hypothetical protein VMM12_07810 [Longimicrobiales bacterium]|nr:hypothetical protein [Longimicrobiales bacterium]